MDATMTPSSPSPTQPVPVRQIHRAIPVSIAIAFLALNALVLVPLLHSSGAGMSANLLYILVRLGTFVALSLSLTLYCGRNRFQAIATTTLVAFIDHAGFKGLLLASELSQNPTNVIYGLMVSFIATFPILVIVAFLGAEGGLSFLKKRGTSS